jgi:hypothetical protein
MRVLGLELVESMLQTGQGYRHYILVIHGLQLRIVRIQRLINYVSLWLYIHCFRGVISLDLSGLRNTHKSLMAVRGMMHRIDEEGYCWFYGGCLCSWLSGKGWKWILYRLRANSGF